MVTIRCTKKLLSRLRLPSKMETPESTTALGDWYGNLLFTRSSQTLLLISERSFFPVVLEARGIDTLVPRFQLTVKQMLAKIGALENAVAFELEQMAKISYGPTKSRVVLGVMNDFAFQIEYYLKSRPALSLFEISLQLSKCPCSPLKMGSPVDVTLDLLKNFFAMK
jgi:hypothetical protein